MTWLHCDIFIRVVDSLLQPYMSAWQEHYIVQTPAHMHVQHNNVVQTLNISRASPGKWLVYG